MLFGFLAAALGCAGVLPVTAPATGPTSAPAPEAPKRWLVPAIVGGVVAVLGAGVILLTQSGDSTQRIEVRWP